MQTIETLRTVSRILMLLAGLCFFYQTVYLVISVFLPLKKRENLPAVIPAELPRFGILIAARNEEAVLPYLLQSIREQDYPQELMRVFVVADNCTDQTAQVAECAGATVWRRYNREKIGKGYALTFLLDHMQRSGQMEAWTRSLFSMRIICSAPTICARSAGCIPRALMPSTAIATQKISATAGFPLATRCGFYMTAFT